MSNYLFKPSAQTLPYANVNGAYVNKFNTNWSGSFSSNESPARFGLPEPVNKDQAAIPYIKGMGMKGGSKRHSSYKKKSMRKYKKMARRSTKSRRVKRSVKARRTRRSVKARRTSRSRRGGTYHQWGSNIPNTPSFSTGGPLAAKNSAEANPVPQHKLSECTNCVDNYRHTTNKGFQFW